MQDVRDATTLAACGPPVGSEGMVRIDKERVFHDPFRQLKVVPDVAPDLTKEQRAAAEAIDDTLGTAVGHLLVGVNGSGKTEVYMRLIKRVLERGEGALVLVPEIALTPQLVTRFRARLGDAIAIQHSDWMRTLGMNNGSDRRRRTTGCHRCAFRALRPHFDLGLIVVDEEHENTYKQDSSPRYHARDMALVRGHAAGCPVVLGTATPSLESWTNTQGGSSVAAPHRTGQSTSDALSRTDRSSRDSHCGRCQTYQCTLGRRDSRDP